MTTAIWTLHKHNKFNTLSNIVKLFDRLIEHKDPERENLSWSRALGVVKKTIFEDNVDSSHNNIAFIRVPCLSYQPQHALGHRNWNWERDILPVVNWCLDNHIKVVLDDCWENGAVFYKTRRGKLTEWWPFLLENNIKILTNVPPLYDLYHFDTKDDDTFKFQIEDWKKVYIDAKFFLFHTRQVHQQENYIFKMNTYPTLHEDKKYLFSCMFGDITKKNNAMLYGLLLKNNLIDDDVFISTIMEKSEPELLDKKQYTLHSGSRTQWAMSLNRSHEIVDWVNENKDIIYQHMPFERNAWQINKMKVDGEAERRIPQELYDSHFAINVETMHYPWFYTEKTFKHIIAKVPFLSYGGSYHSSGLKKYLGFERFEEIFDYSFEEIPPKNTHHFLLMDGINSNIKRLKQEPVSIFNQASVREKLDYNESLFYKLSTTDRVKEHLENIIGAV